MSEAQGALLARRLPRLADDGRDPLLYMLARKPLDQNTRVLKQAGSLARAGYTVEVLAVRAAGGSAVEHIDGAKVLRLPVERRPEASGGRLRRLSFPLRWLAYYARAYRVLAQSRRRPAVIHCNDLDTLPIGILAARRHRVPVVYDAQDLYAEQDHIPRWLSKPLTWLERLLVRGVDRVITVNEDIAAVMEQRLRVHVDGVVLNCPPYEDRLPSRTEWGIRRAVGVRDEQTLVVYSGVLSPHRGLENSIAALRYLDDTCLAVLGEGPLRASLERAAARYGVSERVFFTGFVPHRQVPAFISSADIGIVPYEHVGLNHYLCSPNKLFHYIMAELPVACSDFPFLRGVVIGNAIGAVFDPSEPRSIALAVAAIRDSPDAAETRRRRLKDIRRRYCWEEEERRLLGVYESLRVRATPR